MCLDKGYDYDNTRELVREFGFTAHVLRGARRPKRSSGRPATVRDVGSWNGHIAG